MTNNLKLFQITQNTKASLFYHDFQQSDQQFAEKAIEPFELDKNGQPSPDGFGGLQRKEHHAFT